MKKANTLVLIIALILAIGIGEIALRGYFSANNLIIGATQEEKCNRDMIRRMNDPNHQYYQQLWSATGIDYSKHAGLIPRPNEIIKQQTPFVDEDGKRGIVTSYTQFTNAQRMRGSKDVNKTKNPDDLRIAVFGDSFTWGTDGHYMFSYAKMLENLIPHVEVLNFGLEGIGLDTMFMRWRYESIPYNPDVLIFAIYIDDIARIQPCLQKPNFSRKGDRLIVTNVPPPRMKAIKANYHEPKLESYLWKHIKYTLRYRGGLRKAQYKEFFPVAELILKQVKKNSQKTYFMVVIIEKGNHGVASEPEINAVQELRALLTKLDIPFVSANEIFENENYTPLDPTPHQAISHFTPEGYAYLAQGIKQHLEKAELLPKHPDYTFTMGEDFSSLTLVDKNTEESHTLLAYTLFEKDENI